MSTPALTISLQHRSPLLDFLTHTLYVTKSDISWLPLRRTLRRPAELRESVIHLGDLLAKNRLLLRVKHVALDFSQDFAGPSSVVPGTRIIAKVSSKYQAQAMQTSKDRLLVFPVSTCWLQDRDLCAGCAATNSASRDETLTYEHHRLNPCERPLTYGANIDGGLQDYLCVPEPAHSLVQIPRNVSLHDGCFLLDIALPFFAFCHDVLCGLLAKAPGSRVLVLLNDAQKEANDCLLVIQRLQLNQLIFTLSDVPRAEQMAATYVNKFHHVLVFSRHFKAVALAQALGIATGLELTRRQHTLTVFTSAPLPQLTDRSVSRVKLTFKDRFLLEELLDELATMNKHSAEPKNSDASIKTAYSELTGSLNSTQTAESGESKKHVQWLECDADFRLCQDDNCLDETAGKCRLTADINKMLAANCQLRRVFFSHHPASHVKLNAFII